VCSSDLWSGSFADDTDALRSAATAGDAASKSATVTPISARDSLPFPCSSTPTLRRRGYSPMAINDSVEELKPGAVLGGHRIEALAARGGWSVVYRATDLATRRPAAVKAISAELAGDPDYRDRFRRECEIGAAIEHPHVPAVYALGDGYAVLQWIEGKSLRELAPLDPLRATRIVAQIGTALDLLHARGLVHRDVKPTNVIVETRARGDHAFLTDFGLAKEISADPGLTAAGRWLGTVDFAAPEQIRGGPTDARSDVYSLGCVLGFALTGLPPYPRADSTATMQAHLHEPPPQLWPPLTTMNAVLSRALAKDPRHRFQSAGELGRAACAAAAAGPRRERRRTLLAGAVIAASVVASVTTTLVVWSGADGGGGSDEPAVTEELGGEPPPLSGGPINLLPEGNLESFGSARVVLEGSRQLLEVEAELGRARRGQVYELWLYNDRRDARSLGTAAPGRDDVLRVSRLLPRGFTRYRYIDLSIEPRNGDERHGARSVMRGALPELEEAR
jgi:hypothetical protein